MRGPRANTNWTTIGGVRLAIDAAPSDPVTPAHCWWPLHRAARRAELEHSPQAIHLDDFEWVGVRYRRGANLPAWIYLHRRTRAELYATQEGGLLRMRASRTDIGSGRLVTCTVPQAIEHAGLSGTSPIPPLGPPGPDGEHSPGSAALAVAHLRDPGAYPHSREARLQRLALTSACYASRRLVRWPLGPGGHRLGADQSEDELGRCPDHRCARCYREPAASVSADLFAVLHRVCCEELRPLLPGGVPSPPPLELFDPPRGPSRPRPHPRSPYRPLLRQVWPPTGPSPQAGLN